MAGKIKGITITLGADVQPLNKALADVNKKSKDLQSELKAVERLLKFDPKNTDLLAQRQKLLADAVANSKEKLDRLKTAQQQVNEQFKKGEINEEQYRAFQREVTKAEQELKKFETQLKSTGMTAEQLGQKIQGIGQKMTGIGKDLSMKVTAPLVGLGVAAVKTGMDFEAAMSEVGAISGATGEDLEKLEALAREMGATTKFSASEAAEGLKYMAMAGWDTQQQLDGLPGVLNLAAASGESLGTVSDIVTDAMTAFGMEASQAGEFADILAAASSNANTNVGMLGESFKYVAPVAGALGYEAKDTATALGLMANAGIKSSQAGSALRTILTNMAKPTAQMQVAMDKYGISLTNADGSMKSLDEVMFNLRDSLGGLTEAEQAAAAATIFGKEAMSGALAIVNTGEEDYNKLSGAINNSTGAAERMSKAMQDNVKGRLTELKSALEGVALQFFDAMKPALEAVTASLQKFVDWLAAVSPTTKAVIIVIAGVAAAIGPLLIAFGLVAQGVGAVVAAAGALSGAFAAISGVIIPALSAALGAITLPVAAVVAAFVGLVAAGVAVYKNWDEIKAFGAKLWEDLKIGWTEGMEALKKGWTEGWAAIGTMFKGWGEQIASAWSTLWDGLKKFLVEWWPLLLGAIAGPMGLVAGAIYKNWDEIKAKTVEVWDSIKAFFEEWWKKLTDWMGTWDPWGAVKNLWNEFKTKIIEVWTNLKTETNTWWNIFTTWLSTWNPWNFVQAKWNEFKTQIMQVWDKLKTETGAWWNTFTAWLGTWNPWNFVKAKWNEFKTQIMQVWTNLKTETNTWWSTFTSWLGTWNPWAFVKQIWDNFKTNILGVWNNLKTDTDTWWNTFTTWLGTWNPWNFVKAKWNEFKANIMQVWTNLKTETNTWWNTFTSWLSTWNPWNFVQTKWNEFKTKIIQVWTNLKTETSTWWATFTTWLGTWNPWNTVKEIWNNFKTNIIGVWTDLNTTLNTWWDTFTTWLGTWNPWSAVEALWDTWKSNTIRVWNDLKASALNFGRDIVQGLADGITEKLSAAKNAISNVANSIKSSVKGILGIASPSVVMHAFGEAVSTGLANGIEAKAGVAIQAATTMASAIQTQAAAAMAAVSAIAQAAADAANISVPDIGKQEEGDWKGAFVHPNYTSALASETAWRKFWADYSEPLRNMGADIRTLQRDLLMAAYEMSVNPALQLAEIYIAPDVPNYQLTQSRLFRGIPRDTVRMVSERLLRAQFTPREMAAGGIVTRPTLSVIGEAGYPEAVLPLPKLQPMMIDALLGAVTALGGNITNNKQINLQVINRGTVIGRGGMEEFAKTVSKQISRDFGLAAGGAW